MIKWTSKLWLGMNNSWDVFGFYRSSERPLTEMDGSRQRKVWQNYSPLLSFYFSLHIVPIVPLLYMVDDNHVHGCNNNLLSWMTAIGEELFHKRISGEICSTASRGSRHWAVAWRHQKGSSRWLKIPYLLTP